MGNEVQVITTKEVENLVIDLRGQKVILDRDVAVLYGTETREIIKAVRNNPDNFLKAIVSHCKYLKSSMWWKNSTGWRAEKLIIYYNYSPFSSSFKYLDTRIWKKIGQLHSRPSSA